MRSSEFSCLASNSEYPNVRVQKTIKVEVANGDSKLILVKIFLFSINFYQFNNCISFFNKKGMITKRFEMAKYCKVF